MERGGTTIEKLIQKPVEQAEAEEHLAAFAPAGDKQVNGASVEKHFVADVKVVHDHVKEDRRWSVSGRIPGSEPSGQ